MIICVSAYSKKNTSFFLFFRSYEDQLGPTQIATISGNKISVLEPLHLYFYK